MVKSNYKTIIISTLNNPEKEDLPISILETKKSTFITKKRDFFMRVVNAYWTSCKLKEL